MKRYEIQRSKAGYYKIWDRIEQQFVKDNHEGRDWWHLIRCVTESFMAKLEENPPEPTRKEINPRAKFSQFAAQVNGTLISSTVCPKLTPKAYRKFIADQYNTDEINIIIESAK